ncbi:E3 ubiquitin-protein ligase RZF1-like [Neltuma alba]|uniref:E3 ubiquitin-protein ligase RZF1-like n=1 Tax=Neltuma alba TaxID=207710 RepID=UPI0010A3DF56|nr:E3 ubiquitin-protein ligase RZF1-like [Prosopis alba]XP_028774132.1 E3 ubiquitin-protein ligase RZF1-like [Prosopis alba]XP_028788275.1 E3 ubiquitin-protein ligase RZF1-like [Prosopis alba]
MADSSQNVQQYFCIDCKVIYAPPNSVFCPHCHRPISLSKMRRPAGYESIERYRASQASSKKPAPRSSLRKMEQLEITPHLLEKQPKCPICQEEFELEENVKAMRCGHYFHEACSQSWLGGQKNECPFCKATLPHAGSCSTPSSCTLT